MELIPAVDIRQGRCVRLKKGRIEDETVYDDSPLRAARGWEQEGAKRLHIVDLDGAFGGRPQNMDLILEVIDQVSVPVQVGGGIRSLQVARDYAAAGADRVIFGTLAVREPETVGAAVEELGQERVAVGIDVKRESVAIEGWVTTGGDALTVAREMKELGVEYLIYTDITRDGTLAGVRCEEIARFVEQVGMKTVVSGGIGSLDDVAQICSIPVDNIVGVIIGQALYTGALEFAAAQELIEGSDCQC